MNNTLAAVVIPIVTFTCLHGRLFLRQHIGYAVAIFVSMDAVPFFEDEFIFSTVCSSVDDRILSLKYSVLVIVLFKALDMLRESSLFFYMT